MNVATAVRAHRTELLFGITIGLLGACASLAQPLVIGDMIAAVEDQSSIVRPLVYAGLLFAADAALAATHAYVIGRAGSSIVFDLRRALTGRLLRSDVRAFRELEHGDVSTRLVADTSVARMAIADSLTQITTSGFMVVGGLALMAWVDAWLLAVALACLGLASAVSLGLAVQIRRVAVRNREDTGRFGSGLHRVLGAMTTVKASRAEERETETIGDLAELSRRSGVHLSALSSLMTPAMNVGSQVSLAAVIGVGMSRVAQGGLSSADLTSFVMFLFYLVTPLVLLFVSIGRLQQGRAAISRVEMIGAIRQEEAVPANPVHAADGPAVEFDRVGFAYNGDGPVLRDVSFTAPDRGVTAIVGPSGAGKSTIFQLIERFYAPDRGTIRVAGADTARMPLDELRHLVGYVEQEPALMRGTIRGNVTYAQPDATDDEIAEAVRAANLTDLIARLPDGLDTDLGEGGIGLSGGERQRLAVARTLLQRPRVVLLDEVTAHLDSDAEAALTETMTTIARTCAVLVIAHRLSTVIDADRIILLQDGQVRATGTHDTLLSDDEVYRRLAAHQLAANGRHEWPVPQMS
jgi:ABC-type multidrug transport system fused ATPase/permease subunit